jgi:RNA polymerase sigma-70 factor, ECF subfamily
METDIELLNAARRMNKDALVKIFDLYSSALYKYALSLRYDPVTADHIVGDVFAKLLDKFSSGQGPSADLRSYLYQATYHRLIDETRFSKRRASLEAVEWLRQDVRAGYISLEDQILYKQILHAIQNHLTTDQRHVIILRFLEGFSLRDTATIIGKKEDHVKVIQSRAIAKLRKAKAYQYNEIRSARQSSA